MPKDTSETSSDNVSRRKAYQVPSPEHFPADFYVEIVASEAIEVDDALAEAFERKEPGARGEVLKKAAARKTSFTTALDFVGGLIGLRFHYLLVRTLIVEQLYAYRAQSESYAFQWSLPVEVTEAYMWDLSDEDRVAEARRRIGADLQPGWTLEKAGEVLGWVLRGWGTRDPVLKFVSLFISLECAIPGPPEAPALPEPTDPRTSWEENKSDLLTLVSGGGQQNRTRLLAFVSGLRAPAPSLASRFEMWAAKGGLRGWESDVAAFRRFNRMRNALLHEGEADIKEKVEVGAVDVRTLEDIVERYVSVALFGDANVYQSAKRPVPCAAASNGASRSMAPQSAQAPRAASVRRCRVSRGARMSAAASSNMASASDRAPSRRPPR
jgi:hypothetical protein